MYEARQKAWETRRAKYGPSGHSGAYRRFTACPSCRGAVALIIRLHNEGALSEGQVARALGLHRIEVRRLAQNEGGVDG
jgi:hypothetical protein